MNDWAQLPPGWPTVEELLVKAYERKGYLRGRGDLLGELPIIERLIARLTAKEITT